MSTSCQTDFYKVGHAPIYPDGTTKIYSNLTPRKSRMKGVNSVVVFGIQYFILEYLIKQWNADFFLFTPEVRKTIPKAILEGHRLRVVGRYKRMMDFTLGKNTVDMRYMEELWDLGYLPLEIKALPEGTLCPIGVPCMTITNTVNSAFWLVNYLETIFSCTVWQPITSATISYEYKKLLTKYAVETTGNPDVMFQAHDFSMRGMSSFESAKTSGAGHLLSFFGTDTIPAIEFLEEYYDANIEKELIGTSVIATEHSVECMNCEGTMEGEYLHTKRLITELHPTGIVSKVSDTTDLWSVITKVLPRLKEEILTRDGKLVIRPDSGDPADIICGLNTGVHGVNVFYNNEAENTVENKGVIELLWEIFGGTINELEYKVLDPHIGAIYGDSITLERADDILRRLQAKGFASTNIVLGIGSYTYQYNTRDTFGFAIKATYGEVQEPCSCSESAAIYCGSKCQKSVGREIMKDPITDDGTKKSKKGLLSVKYDMFDGTLHCLDQQTKEQEKQGLLKTVFLDGKLIIKQSLSEIRLRLTNE